MRRTCTGLLLFVVPLACSTSHPGSGGAQPGADAGLDGTTAEAAGGEGGLEPDSASTGRDGAAPEAGHDGAIDGPGVPDSAVADGPTRDGAPEGSTVGGADGGQAGPVCVVCPGGTAACATPLGATGGALETDGPTLLCASTPDHGCASGSCAPCTLANAWAKCAAGACAVDVCIAPWGDCDGTATNGCETNLSTSSTSCGACGTTCSAGATCQDGNCVTTCSPPLTNCSGTCTNLVTSVSNCGGCGQHCTPAGRETVECSGGTCLPTPLPCPSGTTLCGGKCVDTGGDPQNCGECGVQCSLKENVVTTCVMGACTGSCPAGTTGCTLSGGPVYCADTQLDSTFCGGCSSAGCVPGQTCQGGACVSLSTLAFATGLNVTDMQVDDNAVYFIDDSAGSINMVPNTGGAVVPLATGQAGPQHLALDAQYVYFSNHLGGAIMRVAKVGGSAQLVAVATQPTELVVDSQNVYWINAPSTLLWAPKDGSGMAAAYPACSTFGMPIVELRQNTTTLFWYETNASGHSIPKSGAGGCNLGVLGIGCDNMYSALAVDDSFVYSTCPGSDLMQTAVSGVGPSTMIAAMTINGPSPFGKWPASISDPVLVDGTDLYFYQRGLRKASACTNEYLPLLLDVGGTLLAVDASYVYWSDGTMIGRVPR